MIFHVSIFKSILFTVKSISLYFFHLVYESVVVLGDLNARVGNEVIEGVVRRHGVPGRNESGERLLEMCAEQ